MKLNDQPIQQKLKSIMLLTSATVLLLACTAFVTYEWIMERQAMARNLSTLAKITALNSTAVLAFENPSDAQGVLSALRVEKHIVAAALYDQRGRLFAQYPTNQAASAFPSAPQEQGPRFAASYLSLVVPVIENGKPLGSLYLESDLAALWAKFRLYGVIVLLVMAVSWLAAFAISASMQKRISRPILALAATAKAVSDRKDYSVRARKVGEDEIGLLTDAFNQMLDQIQEQNTERKRVEAVQAHFVAIVESSLDAIIGKTVQGVITSWNPGAEKLFGYSAQEIQGQSALLLIPPERAYEETEILAQIARGETIPPFETVRVRKDGQRIDVSVTISPMKDRAGNIIGASKIARDITERKQAEEALRQSEERLRAFLSASSDVVYRMSSDWSEMRQLHGRNFIADTEKPSGTWFQEYIHPDDQPHVRAVINEAIRTKSTFELEHRVRRVDGTLGWTFSRAIPLTDAKGEIIEWFGAASDVSERKRAEEEIRKLNQGLEDRVAIRTTELEAANKDLEAFSYSVSHDLRAPLRHIAGFLQLLQKQASSALDAKCQRYMNMISEAAGQMGCLIDDLLSFSRTGRAELRKSGLRLEEMIHGVIQDLKPETDGREVVWKIGALPEVQADPSLLRQVLVNLLSNAVKYSRTRLRAEVEIGAQPGHDDETVFFVRDNGVGFDMKYAGKLFGVFQRLHDADEFEGTGIGLANVGRIINRHGGRAWAEAVVDKGATFYFSLPKSQPKAI